MFYFFYFCCKCNKNCRYFPDYFNKKSILYLNLTSFALVVNQLKTKFRKSCRVLIYLSRFLYNQTHLIEKNSFYGYQWPFLRPAHATYLRESRQCRLWGLFGGKNPKYFGSANTKTISTKKDSLSVSKGVFILCRIQYQAFFLFALSLYCYIFFFMLFSVSLSHRENT